MEARRAGPDHLDASEERADLHVASRELRVDRGGSRKHLLKGHVVGDPAQQGVRHVVVQVDESRKDGAAGAIEHVVRGTIGRSNGSDPPAFDEDVPGQPATLGVLGHDDSAAQQEGFRIAAGRVEHSRFVDTLPDVPFLGRLREDQLRHASQVIEEDARPIRSVTGIDIAYRGDEAYAAAATLEVETLRTVAVASVRTRVGFPYIPGYLAFREMPGIEAAVRQLPKRPEAIMIDGHGRLHPALFGVACHAGVRLDIPTVGVAKHPLAGRVDSTQDKGPGAHPSRIEGKTRGYAWIPPNRQRPVYVSVGHRVSLGTALALVQRTTRVGYPEPLRIADRLAGEMKGE